MATILKKIEKITNGFTDSATVSKLLKSDLENKSYLGQRVYNVIKKNKEMIWYRSGITNNNVFYERSTHVCWISKIKI